MIVEGVFFYLTLSKPALSLLYPSQYSTHPSTKGELKRVGEKVSRIAKPHRSSLNNTKRRLFLLYPHLFHLPSVTNLLSHSSHLYFYIFFFFPIFFLVSFNYSTFNFAKPYDSHSLLKRSVTSKTFRCSKGSIQLANEIPQVQCLPILHPLNQRFPPKDSLYFTLSFHLKN